MRHHFIFPILAFAAAACGSPSPSSAPTTTPASHVAGTTAAPAPAKPAKRSLEERIAELQKEALASHAAVDFVRAITRDVGARLAGSANDAKAVAWAEQRLTAEGFTNVHRERAMVSHWERGPATGAIVSKGKRTPLELLALGRSGSTPKGGLDAQVVRVESLEAAKALGRKELAGKVLFFDVPTARARDGSGYGHSAGARYAGSQVAVERGAVAMVIRSISPDPAVPHTGTTAHAGLPSVALAGTSADALRDALAADLKAKVHLDVTARMLPDVESANVVGEIRGSERPDEVVLLGAHLDSWDVGEGASDDGAGCAIVAEAARLTAKYAPRRTVRVVLFASEELGDAPGATTYAETHAAELEKIIVAFEADAGEGRAYAFRAAVRPEHAPSVARIVSFLAPLGVEHDSHVAGAGTDVSPLHDKGVPVFQLRQDMTKYFDIHHTKSDVFEHIDQEALTQATAAYAVTAYATAELDETLGRAPEGPKAHW
ncbi:M28 family peptidase [Pendulispora rubella]|uniref:Carboxypeptidase Q n=1 Tax=Pendulispora rubella TaxID=2741070 RepID=A0ABZ2LDC5_9BACT